MMRALISKSSIRGTVTAPSSKSYTIRGLLCAALATGDSEIVRPLGSDDTEASLGVLGKLGVRVRQETDLWRVRGGNLHSPEGDLYCRDSALTLRFMTAIASTIPAKCHLTAGPSLAKRPIEPLLEALRQLGVDCRFHSDLACVEVAGRKLGGGTTSLPGNISSQFVSALLLISPLAESGMTIRVTTQMESQPFVAMTLECLQLFGVEAKASADWRTFHTARQDYRPTRYLVEGDWSSASYLVALGALGGEITVENLNPSSLQGDKAIVDFLKEMGATVTVGENSVKVSRSRLKGIKADFTDCIDLLPTMAVLAAAAEGRSEFTGIARARLKESDRVGAMREGLERMGIRVVEEQDRLIIEGGTPKAAVIASRSDHRIAMAFSMLGTISGGMIIEQAECVSKTFPEFWDILRSIGGSIKLDEQ
ncbi:MAG: 3-phosphoshikimate 1-carboxyvinyltransferase [Chloroflexi bacterium]|nr:3-phosphoshikimate 1-carboxyvinyltransferase [Chloroflexota bacterium]